MYLLTPIHQSRAQGFTLVEILVVVMIIGLTTSLAMIQFSGREYRLLRQEADRLSMTLNLAQDQSAFQFQTLGVEFTDSGYRFYRYRPSAQQWQLLEDGPLAPHRFALPLTLELQPEGNRLDLPQENPDSHTPHIVYASSGENTAFQLSIYLPDDSSDDARQTLYSDGFQPTSQQHPDEKRS